MKARSVLFVVSIFYLTSAHGQTAIGFGTVTGTVYDYTGSGIPDTTVILSNERMRVQRTMETSDEGAFNDLVGIHRAELRSYCYRMLGSVQDAEDAVQNAMLRAWRGLSAFEGRSSVRSSSRGSEADTPGPSPTAPSPST